MCLTEVKMAVNHYKMAILIMLFLNVLNIMAHGDPSSSDSDSGTDNEISEASDSDDMEHEKIARRSVNQRQWQYEGMPIDLPLRRDRDGNSLERKLLQTPYFPPAPMPTTVDPPLDPRYRRIYNADETASILDYPFMAALLVNRALWCGAVILDRDIILTAAHCLQLQYNNRFFREYVKMLTVRVGSSNATAGGEVLQVSEIFFHPNYKPHTLEFNFAVLKLHKNITFSKKEPRVGSIEYSTDKIVPVNKKITFLGWGSVLGFDGSGGEVLLQKVDMPVYDLADCQAIYGKNLVTRNNFCAGFITVKKNVCNHDGGGPAVMGGALVGILSFSAKRCDEPDKPAVFSSVGAVARWLDEVQATAHTSLRNLLHVYDMSCKQTSKKSLKKLQGEIASLIRGQGNLVRYSKSCIPHQPKVKRASISQLIINR